MNEDDLGKRRAAAGGVLAAGGLILTLMAAPAVAAEGSAAGGPSAVPAAATGLVAKALQATRGAAEVVFAVRGLYADGHYYANFGHWSLDPNRMMYAPGGARLCKLNLQTGQLTVLVEDREGSIRDPQVHYDGRKILFCYRPGGTRHFHLYEIAGDGSGLRQLTDGPFDDVEPTYLPDGGILFCSSRCNRFVACWYTPVATLHRIDADGGKLRILSSNIVHENTPSVLPDGRILYTRWEYIDRDPSKFHGLWTMNPDGTGQMIYFGNSTANPWVLMIDAKPIPNSTQIVAVFSPHHGNREHEGNIVVLDAQAGPDQPRRPRQISPQIALANGWMGGPVGFRDPYPLASDCFLVAQGNRLLLMDDRGQTQAVHEADMMVHEPCPLQPRPRERIVPPRSNPGETTGRLVLSDVYHGRHLNGVRPGEIKKLLVLEQLPKPASFSGMQQNLSMNGTFTLKRILGAVPVAADGSASIEVPALRSLYLVALDENDLSVKSMQSFFTVMPGETLGCVGCHEQRAQAAPPRETLQALQDPPRRPQPIPDVPDVIDYPRDIQPILDRHCVECHSADRPEGKVVLTGDHNEWFSQSYYALFARHQVNDGWGYLEDGNRPPRSLGSAASPLMKMIDGSHYRAQLSPTERNRVRLWLDTGAAYPGTYAALQAGTVTVKVPMPVLERRCASCHPAPPKDDRRSVITEPRLYGGEPLHEGGGGRATTVLMALGPRIRKVRALHTRTGYSNVSDYCLNLYNLTHPEKSLILLAPLAKSAGGYGWCRATAGEGQTGQPAAVFADTADGDYQAILSAVSAAGKTLQTIKRFDMPGFRPNEHYVRELKRYGILPPEFDPATDAIDVYETDRAYWRSLWHQGGEVRAVKTASATHGTPGDRRP
ncbi:MAG: hypothetical protein GX575_29035 [Candidatus Anammoximicrobium sp.]|nr:hypothetical protein [Candidatus Anammoximicrobium sp.]